MGDPEGMTPHSIPRNEQSAQESEGWETVTVSSAGRLLTCTSQTAHPTRMHIICI